MGLGWEWLLSFGDDPSGDDKKARAAFVDGVTLSYLQSLRNDQRARDELDGTLRSVEEKKKAEGRWLVITAGQKVNWT